ncbi:MAG: PEP-CTERM sorting domain-containing protein [Methylomonas sp.]|nr:PEP-CTERM sorting domain-containing protein [Methylomonas sp.]PPD21060.1 MAG: hypothetical protein CTY23_06855 [Methylomonas sp.]PPD25310.1 MAG: hypothetical protein CTY22_09195 [Methylomonas sp.]PPD35288.1 MAG: hypothetical protein CTY21_09195 [Methylomonas sp.]PPD38503.1 MAG: hypothetical protein CTY17_09295 [Methylomonas sp.]
MSRFNAVFAGLFALTTMLPVHAASIVVDGNVSDWGLSRNGNANDWIPNRVISSNLEYIIEDQTGGASVRLFPGWGGQAYDVEALYAFTNTSHLFIALITGLSPNTPNNPAANSYGPGDFAIDFGSDGSFEFGIETTGANAGAVFRISEWAYGLWDSLGNYNPTNPDRRHPTSILAGILVGDGDLIYTDTPFKNMGVHRNDAHYVIEAAIPLSVFTGFSGKFDIHWTMNCANDALLLDPFLPPSAVPEPSIIALLAFGILALSNRRSAPAGQPA